MRGGATLPQGAVDPEAWAEIVVAVDNLLGAHKGERVRALLEERGAELLYLPPYSPDLNPIEESL